MLRQIAAEHPDDRGAAQRTRRHPAPPRKVSPRRSSPTIRRSLALGALQPRHWRLLYARGIALERSKQWPRAEADFLRALEFEPDEPFVLNYLGYSWVEQGKNLDKAEEMIRKAVELRPGDGYIVDSLGWVLFRLGRHEEAVVHLERAVELKPEDPVINDHLGDAYWAVGRQREARYQWQTALASKPEPELKAATRTEAATGDCLGKRAPTPSDRRLPTGSPCWRRRRSTSTCTSSVAGRTAITCSTAWSCSPTCGDRIEVAAGRNITAHRRWSIRGGRSGRRRQPGAARRARPGGRSRRTGGGGDPADQVAAGRVGHRRRLGRRGGDAAGSAAALAGRHRRRAIAAAGACAGRRRADVPQRLAGVRRRHRRKDRSGSRLAGFRASAGQPAGGVADRAGIRPTRRSILAISPLRWRAARGRARAGGDAGAAAATTFRRRQRRPRRRWRSCCGALAAAPGVLLSRMSGSGATCFGLCDTPAAASGGRAALWPPNTPIGGSKRLPLRPRPLPAKFLR